MRQENTFVFLLDFGSASSDNSCLPLGGMCVCRVQHLLSGQCRQVLLFISLLTFCFPLYCHPSLGYIVLMDVRETQGTDVIGGRKWNCPIFPIGPSRLFLRGPCGTFFFLHWSLPSGSLSTKHLLLPSPWGAFAFTFWEIYLLIL